MNKFLAALVVVFACSTLAYAGDWGFNISYNNGYSVIEEYPTYHPRYTTYAYYSDCRPVVVERYYSPGVIYTRPAYVYRQPRVIYNVERPHVIREYRNFRHHR